MFGITGTLRVLILLVVLSHLPVCSGWTVDATRLSLKPVYYEKSCRDGMVTYKDYFVLKGLINISNIEGGQRGWASIYYIDRRTRDNEWIVESTVKLKEVTCRDLNHVNIDTCACKFMDSKYVRIMCNFTAKIIYSRGIFNMCFALRGHIYSPGFQIPTVYGTPVCIGPSVSRAAKSLPGRFFSVLGTAFLGAAVVCQVSSGK